ncbi:MAG TPA: hypothetical protein VGB22_01290 [candidate division Zixibacteria bacterium]|jgi:hypothetical protein
MKVFQAVCFTLLLAMPIHAGVYARTYELVGFKEKFPHGNWWTGCNREWITRWETAGARWSIEVGCDSTFDEKNESSIRVMLLDSTGKTYWNEIENIGVRPFKAAPAFATGGVFGETAYLYVAINNHDSIIRGPWGPDVIEARDGSAFCTPEKLEIFSLDGIRIGGVTLPDSLAHFTKVSTALSDGGQFIAVGLMEVYEDRRFDTLGYKRLFPGPRKTMLDPGIVAVYRSTGELVGEITLTRKTGGWPRHVALSGHNPPLIAVISDYGPSMWGVAGTQIWSDTNIFRPASRIYPMDYFVADDGSLLVATRNPHTTQDGSDWLIRVWDPDGSVAAELPLPSKIREDGDYGYFFDYGNNSIKFQTRRFITTIRWRD